jgi:hypothetical protein
MDGLKGLLHSVLLAAARARRKAKQSSGRYTKTELAHERE